MIRSIRSVSVLGNTLETQPTTALNPLPPAAEEEIEVANHVDAGGPVANATPPVDRPVLHAGDRIVSGEAADVFIELVKRLTNGWRYERLLRIIFAAQMGLMLKYQDGTPFGTRELNEWYKQLPRELQKTVTTESFMGFLTSQSLVEAFPAIGAITYRVTNSGRSFLEYVRKVGTTNAFPGLSDDPQFTARVAEVGNIAPYAD